jgi:hypothetical protein
LPGDEIGPDLRDQLVLSLRRTALFIVSPLGADLKTAAFGGPLRGKGLDRGAHGKASLGAFDGSVCRH